MLVSAAIVLALLAQQRRSHTWLLWLVAGLALGVVLTLGFGIGANALVS